MKELLVKQINFEYWADKELFVSMRTAQPLADRAQLLFSHLLSVSSRLLSWVKEEAAVTMPFQERTLEESDALLKENNKGWLEYLGNASENDLIKKIVFVFPVDNSKRQMTVADAIMHLVHHSSYHRGQIISLLKGSVEVLPLLTYIIYTSEKI